jgi:hypothetical protein
MENMWESGDWIGTELEALKLMVGSEAGPSPVLIRADIRAAVMKTGSARQVRARLNNLIAHLWKAGLVEREPTYVKILDYEGLRKELERGRPKSKRRQ